MKIISAAASIICVIAFLDSKHMEIKIDWGFLLPTLATLSGGISAWIQIYEFMRRLSKETEDKLDKVKEEIDSNSRRLDELEEFSNEVVRLAAKVEILSINLKKHG